MGLFDFLRKKTAPVENIQNYEKATETTATTGSAEYHGPARYEKQNVEGLRYVLCFDSDGYNATSLYIHAQTNQPYIVKATLDCYGGGYHETYHSISLTTYVDINRKLSINKSEKLKRFIGINANNWESYLDN